MRKATKYDKIVILKDNKFTVLDESFKYSDDFKGLMGSRFEIVSKSKGMEFTHNKYLQHLINEFES